MTRSHQNQKQAELANRDRSKEGLLLLASCSWLGDKDTQLQPTRMQVLAELRIQARPNIVILRTTQRPIFRVANNDLAMKNCYPGTSKSLPPVDLKSQLKCWYWLLKIKKRSKQMCKIKMPNLDILLISWPWSSSPGMIGYPPWAYFYSWVQYDFLHHDGVLPNHHAFD